MPGKPEKLRELKRGAGAKIQTEADLQQLPQEGMGGDRASSSEGAGAKIQTEADLQQLPPGSSVGGNRSSHRRGVRAKPSTVEGLRLDTAGGFARRLALRVAC